MDAGSLSAVDSGTRPNLWKKITVKYIFVYYRKSEDMACV
jgi:hypothetical protein